MATEPDSARTSNAGDAGHAGHAGHAGLTERYEQLPAVALGGGADGWRLGLGVLAGKGMTGWIRAWTACPAPTALGHAAAAAAAAAASPPAPAPASASASLSGTDAGQLVRLLAAMTLAHV